MLSRYCAEMANQASVNQIATRVSGVLMRILALAGAAVSRGGGASQIRASGAPIVLEVNKGTLIRLTASAATVFIANPDIADVQVKSPSLIYLSAKAPGETVIYAVDASDSVLLNSPVRVEHDMSRLRSSLRQLAPGEPISADWSTAIWC